MSECAICLEEMRCPCIYNCGHGACLNCVYASVSKAMNCHMCREPIKTRTPNRMVEWPELTQREREMLDAFAVRGKTNMMSTIVSNSIEKVLMEMDRYTAIKTTAEVVNLMEAWSDLEFAVERMDEQFDMIGGHVKQYISENKDVVHNLVVENVIECIRRLPDASNVLRDCRMEELFDALRKEPDLVFDALPEELISQRLCSVAVCNGVPLWKIPERFRSHSIALEAIVTNVKNIPFMPVGSLDENRVKRWMDSSPSSEDIDRLGDAELINMYDVLPAVFTIIPQDRWENLQRETARTYNVRPGRVWGQ